jgi:glycosyltransferase involved in cell wall biosynthesis
MKIVVAPHDLIVGGSQINAIDLAAAVRDLGHDVVIYGRPGPLVDHVATRDLRFVEASDQQYRPAPQRMAHLASFARREGVDLIHGYEWPPCLDAYFGAHLLRRVPLVCTVLSMAVSPLVPTSIPLIMGTEALADEARRAGFTHVAVGEPPIDTIEDHPGIDGTAIRRELGVDDDELLVVTVSRLAIDLKLDALERIVDAAGELASTHPVRLIVVGGGEAADALQRRADDVNERSGRTVVDLVGQRLDPRPYYAAADVVAGMGSSALRAMAIGKPVVVQGERGFSRPCAPETVATFLRQGFWGIGDDQTDNRLLRDQLDEMLRDRDRRVDLGRFGRDVVVGRFSLERAAVAMVAVYEQTVSRPVSRRPVEAGRMAVRAGWNELLLHDPRRRQARERDHVERLARPARPVEHDDRSARSMVEVGT